MADKPEPSFNTPEEQQMRDRLHGRREAAHRQLIDRSAPQQPTEEKPFLGGQRAYQGEKPGILGRIWNVASAPFTIAGSMATATAFSAGGLLSRPVDYVAGTNIANRFEGAASNAKRDLNAGITDLASFGAANAVKEGWDRSAPKEVGVSGFAFNTARRGFNLAAGGMLAGGAGLAAKGTVAAGGMIARGAGVAGAGTVAAGGATAIIGGGGQVAAPIAAGAVAAPAAQAAGGGLAAAGGLAGVANLGGGIANVAGFGSQFMQAVQGTAAPGMLSSLASHGLGPGALRGLSPMASGWVGGPSRIGSRFSRFVGGQAGGDIAGPANAAASALNSLTMAAKNLTQQLQQGGITGQPSLIGGQQGLPAGPQQNIGGAIGRRVGQFVGGVFNLAKGTESFSNYRGAIGEELGGIAQSGGPLMSMLQMRNLQMGMRERRIGAAIAPAAGMMFGAEQQRMKKLEPLDQEVLRFKALTAAMATAIGNNVLPLNTMAKAAKGVNDRLEAMAKAFGLEQKPVDHPFREFMREGGAGALAVDRPRAIGPQVVKGDSLADRKKRALERMRDRRLGR